MSRWLAVMGTVMILMLVATVAFGQDISPYAYSPPAGKHYGPDHWYDTYCCNRKDCEPVPDEAVSPVKGGYRVSFYSRLRKRQIDMFFPESMLKPSRDGHWHVCIFQGLPRCVYGPLGY